ncbi:MAG: hypothetical protein HT579_20335 [Candidatus Accumulibacter similis]|nr:MAG: hypothetical protein HT579_20335 [Candidatus Accumulibacter similis]
MSQESDSLGLATVILERLERERLPRALDLKAKVDAGERLDELDIAFLEWVFGDMQAAQKVVREHPEYQELAAKMANLYEEITAKGLENEKAEPSG